MQVKICGLTDVRDAELALALGATHIGCVCAPDSPRTAAPEALASVRAAARGRAEFVLVVRGIPFDGIRRLAHALTPELVQWHGASPEQEEAAALEFALLRVREVPAGAAALPTTARATVARPFLLDGGRGGAGRSFDWSLLAAGAPAHTFVAGGITPARLPELLRFMPWAIDVGSGIEQAPGRKDHEAMRALFDCLEVTR